VGAGGWDDVPVFLPNRPALSISTQSRGRVAFDAASSLWLDLQRITLKLQTIRPDSFFAVFVSSPKAG
jgi:hypothetical protein